MRAATVLHVDLDAFFVSMELLRRPELRGLPVIVAGGLGPRGVVNTCSYEARKFGVRSALPIAQARRLCPQGIYLQSDFAFYAPASKQFHAILRDYTPAVEPAGTDEAYLDVAGSERLFGNAATIAKDIRRRVTEEIVVPAGAEAEFLAPRPIRELPMVGPKLAESLAALGVRTIGEIAALPESALVARFGQHGADLRARALGIYEAPVLSGRGEAKTISREITFETDVADRRRLRAVIRGEADRVAADLARQGKAARTVTLKLRFPPFETLTRSVTPGSNLELADEIFSAGAALFEGAWEQNGRRPVRLLGVGVANLVERARQLRLGETGDASRLAETVAGLREKFGDTVIHRAAELEAPRRGHNSQEPRETPLP
jgi:DNA polymerase-4